MSVVDRYGGKRRVLLLSVHGVRRRQALALVLDGRVVVGQGLMVAGRHVLRLEGSQSHCFSGLRTLHYDEP